MCVCIYMALSLYSLTRIALNLIILSVPDVFSLLTMHESEGKLWEEFQQVLLSCSYLKVSPAQIV
jgi:hypothetical protein